MRKVTLDHPSRPILIHLPATSLEHLDTKAREAQLSRSEIIRQLLSPPVKVGGSPPEKLTAKTEEQPRKCQLGASGSTAVRRRGGRRG